MRVPANLDLIARVGLGSRLGGNLAARSGANSSNRKCLHRKSLHRKSLHRMGAPAWLLAFLFALAGANTPAGAGTPVGKPMTLSPYDNDRPADSPSDAATKSGARSAQANPATQPAPAPAQNQPPPQPQRTEILRFENWTVTCLYYAEGPKKHACSARLQVQVQQSGSTQTLLAWTIHPNESNQFVTDLQTPTGVSIAPGVQIEFDKKAKRTLPFDSCETGHCTALSTMDSTFIHELSTAQAAEIVIHAQNGQNIQFNIPIKGFDKAYAQLKANP
jgi:invasion protein IalB